MTDEKRIPKHIKKPTANHPAAGTRLIQILDDVPDPRGASCNFKHPLTSVLLMAIVATLCGANDLVEIVEVSNGLKDWLKQLVDLSKGIPSIYTFDRIFSTICPTKMEEMLRHVMGLIREKKPGAVIAFDGKALRGTADSSKGLAAMHILNAWCSEYGICIGHIKVDDKSNEITAMPVLMDLLDLKGTIVTADALNTQKSIAAKAVEKGADYVLPVKGNHAGLLEEIELLFDDALKNNFKGFDADNYDIEEKGHGRVEKRTYYALDGESLPSAREWSGLKTLGMVIRERTVKGKTTQETIYYISSCEIDAKLLAKCTRSHWGIENGLHWVLDVVLREDKSRYRHRVGARNLAVLRKVVMGILKQDTTLKCGKAAKRLRAATDPQYRESLLKHFF